jgi:hypothetical protein
MTLRATDSFGAFSTFVFSLNVVPDAEVDALGALPAVFGILLKGEKQDNCTPW